MKKLNVILFSIFVCNFAFGNTNATITGILGHRCLCPEMPCLTVDYIIITNDTASFYLVKDGQMLISPQQLGNYTIGNRISIFGSININQDYDNNDFYTLHIIDIITNISDNDFQNIQILPNSTKGVIKIKGIENYNNLDYEVYDLKGQIIQSGNLKQTIDLSNRKGIYILKIMQNQQIVVREKIIVK